LVSEGGAPIFARTPPARYESTATTDAQEIRGALSTVTRTPTRRYEARRSAIVASAVEELNRKGVRGMTLGDVAARLDLVPTGVIYYFKNKEELAGAAFVKAIQRYDAIMAQSQGEATDAERLRAFVRGYIDFRRQVALGEADDIAVFNDVRALNSAQVNAAYVEMFRHARDLLAGPDSLPRPHRNARTHLLLAQMFWVVVWLHRSEVEDYPRAADRMASILVHGLAAPGAAWPRPRPLRLARESDPGAETSSELFLRAATQLINREGYHGASVERISAKLNVSKGAFYHHNETKDDLVVACFQRTFEIVWRAIYAAEREGGSGLQVLTSVAGALVEHQLGADAPLLRTSALSAVPEAIRTGLIEKFDRLSYRFASIISDGVGDGSLRPVDVNIAAQMLTTAINAAAEVHYWAPELTPETVTDHYLRPLFLGLTAPAD
jgi:AcrR family transcriptional regulator